MQKRGYEKLLQFATTLEMIMIHAATHPADE